MIPFCELEFDGASSQVVTSHLLSATVTLESGGDPDKIEVRLADPGAKLPRPREGAKIFCTMGYRGGRSRKHGPFAVDEYGGEFSEDDGEYLTITGTSVDFMSGAKNRATRTHKDTTLGDILKAEAGAEGFKAIISPALKAFKYPHFMRGERSLMQMVGELAEVHDAIEKYKDGKVYFLARAAGVDLAGNLLSHSLGRDALKGWSWKRNFRNNYAGVKASSRDHDKGKRKVVKAPLDKGAPWYEYRKEFPNEQLAEQAAKSKAKQLSRAEKQLEFTCKCGDPDVLEQVVLTFPGVSPEVSGSWIVKQAVHEFDADAESYNTSGTAEMKE
jgi:uncharacterized protein